MPSHDIPFAQVEFPPYQHSHDIPFAQVELLQYLHSHDIPFAQGKFIRERTALNLGSNIFETFNNASAL